MEWPSWQRRSHLQRTVKYLHIPIRTKNELIMIFGKSMKLSFKMQRPKAILVSASGHSTTDHYPDLLDTLPSRYVQQQQSSLPVSPSPHQAGLNRVTKWAGLCVVFRHGAWWVRVRQFSGLLGKIGLPLILVCGHRRGRGNAQKPVWGARLDIWTTLKFAEVLLIRHHDGRQCRGLIEIMGNFDSSRFYSKFLSKLDKSKEYIGYDIKSVKNALF